MAECFGRATAARTGRSWDRGLMGAMCSHSPKRKMDEWLLELAMACLCWVMEAMRLRQEIRLWQAAQIHQPARARHRMLQLLRQRMVRQCRPRMARQCRRV